MSDKSIEEDEFFLLTHPEQWPHGDLLPVVRRSGNAVRDRRDAGIVDKDNISRVYVGVYLGETPVQVNRLDYPSPEALLYIWKID